MDTKGIIQEHSKIKLELYRLYLERYLSVLLRTPFFKSITIRDVFAGCGISENDEKGSALIAAETIDKINLDRNPQKKPIRLKLNDSNPANYSALQAHLKDFSFVNITKLDANLYIQTWRRITGTHDFFFIDPHGYTQVSVNNLKRLFSTVGCDILIFMPISHIYRFRPKEEDGEQFNPIVNFLCDLGINVSNGAKVGNINEFSDLVLRALQSIAGAEKVYVYKQMIENQSHNSTYCLFFITKHILGAEKFLEAQSELKKSLKEKQVQPTFDFVAAFDEKLIRDFIKYGTSYDNVALYKLGIKSGILPREITKELKKLEETNRIEIVELPAKKRNQKGFYIGYEYYNKNNRIISVTFKG